MPFYPSHESTRRQTKRLHAQMLRRVELIPIVMVILFVIHEVLQRIL